LFFATLADDDAARWLAVHIEKLPMFTGHF